MMPRGLACDERTSSLATLTGACAGPYEAVEKMVQHSLSVALLRDGVQVGFACAMTDHPAFTWIADVVVDKRF